jgi:hypothetical protein
LELIVMSDSHSGSFHISRIDNANQAMHPTESQARRSDHAADSAIDLALRTVPLPDGLLMRLAMIVRTIPDGAPEQVDWLGC